MSDLYSWWGVFRGRDLLAVELEESSAKWRAEGLTMPSEISIAPVRIQIEGDRQNLTLTSQRNGEWIWAKP